MQKSEKGFLYFEKIIERKLIFFNFWWKISIFSNSWYFWPEKLQILNHCRAKILKFYPKKTSDGLTKKTVPRQSKNFFSLKSKTVDRPVPRNAGRRFPRPGNKPEPVNELDLRPPLSSVTTKVTSVWASKPPKKLLWLFELPLP